MKSNSTAFSSLCLIRIGMFTGCASTELREVKTYSGGPLPKPERIVVYDFAVSPADIKLSSLSGSRMLRGVGSVAQTEEQLKVGRKVASSMAMELMKKIGELGFPVERATSGTRPSERSLMIEGQFVSVDEGSKILRMVIGFGAGASQVRTLVQVYLEMPSGPLLLEEFETIAESSSKPGLGATMGAGAAVGVLGAAGAAAGGAASGVLDTQATVEADARRTAGEVAKHLAQFFTRQGWMAVNK